MHVEAAIIDMKVRSNEQMMQVQSHIMCTVDDAYDSDDTDDEKVLSENCDEIDVLTVLTESSCRHERSLKALNKNKDIVQEHIEKEKQYVTLKVLCHEDYIDVLKAVKIQDNQKVLKSEVIFETDSDALSDQSLIENLKSLSTLRDLSMSDQSVRKVLTSRKKKLFKKIKAYAFKVSEKLLILLMNQKVESIIVKNIFDILFLIHQMIFQNLF